jgi:polyisoprenoid-binding protein YceI
MTVLTYVFSIFLSLSAFADQSKCTYEFDVANSRVEGTGYKFTDKVGVKAVFPGVKLNKTEKKDSAKALLNDLMVTVDLMSIDSGNALRDKNMRETLFAGILGDSVAHVSVKKLTDKKMTAELKINEKTKMIDFDYEIKGEKISAKGVFDAVDFALGSQLAALKKRCGSLHTGSDGKSVTWSDFNLEVTAALKKVCH